MPFKAPSNFSKANLLQGYKTLNQLWNRDLLPKDLERHYFLHWFVAYQGNIIQTAEALQIHRNTIQGHFVQFGFSNKSVRLRHFWQMLLKKNKKTSFESNFLKFYDRFGGKTKFTPEENKRLIQLWQTRFSFKTLMAHYLLWALRTGKTKDWIQKKLNYSERHRIRLLTTILNPKTRDGFWLIPLKPAAEEIYSPRYRNMLSKIKKSA
jgi:hypothetical protein